MNGLKKGYMVSVRRVLFPLTIFLIAGTVSCAAAQFSIRSVPENENGVFPLRFSMPYGAGESDPVGGLQQEGIRPQSVRSIFIPEHATGSERRAAYELSQWLEQMTGALFPVRSDSSDSSGRAIHIGRTRKAQELSINTEALSHDGYLIAIEGEDLFLAAAEGKGLLNAVFSLLEEDLGCRWLSRDTTVIPWTPVLEASVIPRSFSPPVRLREPGFWSARWQTWGMRNRLNATVVEIPEDAGGYPKWAERSHNFFRLVPPEKYLESNPEYFGLTKETADTFKKRGGSLNLAHPDVLEILIESVRQILKENPGARYMMIAQEDDAVPCMDPLSQAYYDTVEEAPASLLVHFINQVAERLEPEFPEVQFVTYAYQSTQYPPKKVRPRHNVGIRMSYMGMSPGGLLPVTYSRFPEIFSGWRDLTTNLYIYDYWANYLRLPAPQPNLPMIADNIRYFAGEGVHEIYGLGSGWRAKGLADRDEMKSWVIARLLWDPSQDLYRLVEDFCRHYYGPASGKVLEFEQLLDEYRIRYQQAHLEGKKIWLLDDQFNEKATEIIDATLELADSPETIARVNKLRASMAYQWLTAGPERAGGRRYALELENYGPMLLDALETTRFAAPWHAGESPPDWRNYWERKLEEYQRQDGAVVKETAWVRSGTNQDKNFSAGSGNYAMEVAARGGDNNRKAWLKWDIKDLLDAEQIFHDVELRLTINKLIGSPSGVQTFTVYGIVDGSEEWGRGTITWDSAPGNIVSSGTDIRARGTTVLGNFPVDTRAVTNLMQVSLSGKNLDDYLNWGAGRLNDFYQSGVTSNNTLSFIVCAAPSTTTSAAGVVFYGSTSSTAGAKPLLKYKTEKK